MNIVIDKDNFVEKMEFILNIIKKGKSIRVIIEEEVDEKIDEEGFETIIDFGKGVNVKEVLEELKK